MTHLTMCLHYYSEDTSLPGWVDRTSLKTVLHLRGGVFWKLIFASIRHLRLTRLRVIFHCDIRGPESTPAYCEGLIESARNVDFRTAAATLSHGNSTLQYVFTTTTGYIDGGDHPPDGWLRTGGWRMVAGRDGEMGEMDELNSEIAKLVISREELDLCRRTIRSGSYSIEAERAGIAPAVIGWLHR
ncbi:hypothetical protein OH76DRAFT_1098558 [Lentinus brumalis]|uniref:Uncharacterized protein n=1 Tax=Lentinus brumalis TaxID=2498619 RepID=A0A371CVV3_9APHY|nr:hypothetical protein OH76DRAFT_1098558 [Polyporus brumalis]